MALIKCPKCGSKIPANSQTCPRCKKALSLATPSDESSAPIVTPQKTPIDVWKHPVMVVLVAVVAAFTAGYKANDAVVATSHMTVIGNGELADLKKKASQSESLNKQIDALNKKSDQLKSHDLLERWKSAVALVKQLPDIRQVPQDKGMTNRKAFLSTLCDLRGLNLKELNWEILELIDGVARAQSITDQNVHQDLNLAGFLIEKTNDFRGHLLMEAKDKGVDST